MRNFIGSRSISKISYFCPKSLTEALDFLDNCKENVKILAGGTDVIPAVRSGKLLLIDNINILDIKSIDELKHIVFEEEGLRIGATVTLSEVIESEIVKNNCPLLKKAIDQIGSMQIRNWATIGGNICNASPAADSAVSLLALDASLRLQSKGKSRLVPINEFFVGPGKTKLKSDELLTEIIIPKRNGNSTFIKLGRRNAFTLSLISIAVFVQMKDNVISDIKIALGAVAPTPIRAQNTEKILIGGKITEENLKTAVQTIKEEINPINDVRASSEYRRDMSGELLRKALINLFGI
ncbi:FAD binding domain-containing protein [Acetomicrobium sp. UBA5826]|uniref:FAD binding domain-containing protein n=1 Tax=Acetomicrobium sp. UBA5826 TaxID=1946039 RepID=UPI002580971B|nr:xanthine dehydrogenase family protein subunit M [Acetomicrobium sp. UBA5826]